MKIPTDNLFQLIHSMSAAEKRYFKRHYASEKSLLTSLFDFVNGLDIYNESQVKTNFRNTKLSKNLKVYKVQLTELLLKSLVSYHSKKSIKSKIRAGLEEIDILLEKQLYPLALGKLKKLKALCLENEEIEYIFPILYCEIFLHSFYNITLKPIEYPVLDEVNQYADTIKNLYTLKKINFSLQDINNNKLTQQLSSKDISFYKNYFEEKSKSNEKKELGINEQYYLNSSLSLIQKLVFKNSEAELQLKKENISLFENNPSFINNNPGFYFASIYNYLSCCRKLKKYKVLEDGIAKIKTLTQSYPVLQRNLMFIYYLETKHSFQMKKYSYIIEHLEPIINKHIRKYGRKEDSLTALTFIYFILTFLVLGDSDKVNFYFRRLHIIAKNLEPSYSLFILILELICQYESNNSFALQSLLSTHQRKIKKKKLDNPFFIDIVSFFQQLAKTDKKEHKTIANDWKKVLYKYPKDQVFNLTNEFIFDNWFNALVIGKNYTFAMEKT